MFWKASAVHVWLPTSVPVTLIPILTWSSAELANAAEPPPVVGARLDQSVDPLLGASHGPPLGAATIEVAPTLERPRDPDLDAPDRVIAARTAGVGRP